MKLSPLVCLPLLALLALPLSAQTLERVRAGNVLTLGYVDHLQPFSSGAETQPVGYAIELCQRIADRLKREQALPHLQLRYRMVERELDTRNAADAHARTKLVPDESRRVVERVHTGFADGLILVVNGYLDFCIFEVFCDLNVGQRGHRRNAGILHFADDFADRFFDLFVHSVRTKPCHCDSFPAAARAESGGSAGRCPEIMCV